MIVQSFCVIKFYYSIKKIEKASDIGIRRKQKEYPPASLQLDVIQSLAVLLMKERNVLKLKMAPGPSFIKCILG